MSDKPEEEPRSAKERVVEILNKMTPEGDFVPSEVAEKVMAHLEEIDPELLAEFETEMAVATIRMVLTDVYRKRRGRFHKRAAPRAFAAAAASAAEGDTEPLNSFSVRHRVDKSNTQRTVADMTGEDHKFVAEHYQQHGKRDLMVAAFHRQVARLVGKKTTSAVMTEEQYIQLYQSIMKKGETE